MKPYDYSHRTGVLPLTWDDFARLSALLAELLEPFHPEIIVGLARAGLFPATAVACSLRCELYPARLTRRQNDQVITETPAWKVPISPAVAGKVVAIVDEMADSGQTLALAAAQAVELGARQVITASLVRHSWADPAPQLTTMVTDAFVIFPWDEKVRVNGVWVPHPEVEAGLMAQGEEGPML
jgi:hypoxanthine phosphoribosyltransferase